VTHILSIFEFLAINLQVPGQSTLKEGLVFGVFKIQLPVLVALVVGRAIDNSFYILPTQNESTSDDGVVWLPKDTHGAEEVLARSLQSVKEATDLVGGHEDEGELLIVFEVDAVDREPFFVEAV